MKIWYLCKVKYGKEQEDGSFKQVNDSYLLDALSYTEAEALIYQWMEETIGGGFAISQIAKTNLTEVLPDFKKESWYKCKVILMTYDDDSQKEVKVNTYHLVNADHLKEAVYFLDEALGSLSQACEIASIAKTTILEVRIQPEKNRVMESPQIEEN